MLTHLLDEMPCVIMLCKVSNVGIVSWIWDGQKPQFYLHNLDACGQSHDVWSFSFLGERQEEDHVCLETIKVQTSTGQVLQFSWELITQEFGETPE